MVKNPLANSGDAREAGLIPGLERSPGIENVNPLMLLPGKFHGQRNLAGLSPARVTKGHKETDVTKHTHTHTRTHRHRGDKGEEEKMIPKLFIVVLTVF